MDIADIASTRASHQRAPTIAPLKHGKLQPMALHLNPCNSQREGQDQHKTKTWERSADHKNGRGQPSRDNGNGPATTGFAKGNRLLMTIVEFILAEFWCPQLRKNMSYRSIVGHRPIGQILK